MCALFLADRSHCLLSGCRQATADSETRNTILRERLLRSARGDAAVPETEKK